MINVVFSLKKYLVNLNNHIIAYGQENLHVLKQPWSRKNLLQQLEFS